jgi:hypothetical protein
MGENSLEPDFSTLSTSPNQESRPRRSVDPYSEVAESMSTVFAILKPAAANAA